MNKWMAVVLMGVAPFAWVSSAWGERLLEYSATMDQSEWRLASDTPLECRLEHNIPGYGQGAFVSQAGKKVNLDFELAPFRQNVRQQSVTLRAIPPVWRPGQAEQGISTIRFYAQFDGLVDGKAAWTMLSDLERGFYPSFLFKDWYHRGQSVRVSLSSVGFPVRYQAFLSCLNNLLPYSFDDIAFSVLNYESNSDRLTPYSQRRLEQIAQYVKADPTIDLIVLNAYTDSYGGSWINQQLSDKRAAALKAFFVQQGVPAERLQESGHGEKQHIATNATAAGRQTNRRVVISMEKFLPPI